MSCVSAPQLGIPSGLDFFLPTLSLSAALPGANLCCNFEPPPIPGSPFILPLGLIPGIAVVLQPLMAVIMPIIDLLNALLDELQFSCPLE